MLAVTIGRLIGLTPRLTLGSTGGLLGGPRHYETLDDAVNASAKALREIPCLFPDAIVLVHPAYWDYKGTEDPLFRETYEDMIAKLPDVEFVQMTEKLPKPATAKELDSWFNVPHDLHNSDLGLRIYGTAVADYLTHRFRGAKLNTSTAREQGAISRRQCR